MDFENLETCCDCGEPLTIHEKSFNIDICDKCIKLKEEDDKGTNKKGF